MNSYDNYILEKLNKKYPDYSFKIMDRYVYINNKKIYNGELKYHFPGSYYYNMSELLEFKFKELIDGIKYLEQENII